MPPAPPAFLPVSALSVELEAYVAVTASLHAGFAEARTTFECVLPPLRDAGFLVLAGLEPLLDALERFKLKNDELLWLESLGAIDEAARRKLVDMRFSCDVDAALEGTVVFPGEPVLTVEGPFWQAQLVSALVRGGLTSPTLTATRAARCYLAADGAEVIEGSATTAHRLGGNPLGARAAYIGGASATTCALAARRYRLPVRASLPRQFALGDSNARQMFESWLRASQDKAILRFESSEAETAIPGIVEAVRSRASQPSWHQGDIAVEIAGGDHAEVSQMLIDAFEKARLGEPVIVASGDLDEHAIATLRLRETPISAYIVPSFDVDDGNWPARYDLTAIESHGQWSPRMRRGATVADSGDPGRKVIVRYADAEGQWLADVAHATNERVQNARNVEFVDRATGFPSRLSAASGAPLLTNVMRAGKRVSSPEPARALRDRTTRSLVALPERYRRLRGPALYPVGTTPALAAIKQEMLGRGSG
ncbi:hypothetical protein LZC95_47420 [Pendulispora brunnea]|uniref:nicotinate phosphoribosyltransferase n=1 Tax=Pendulispora brunnea TaxID=2905690 RepID=A0ABZ2KCF0_9BACT